jgi:2-methylcitrate dehydratase PrpD
VPAESAAFVNGALAHALDYEDSHDIALIHPNAPTVPAALALAEAFGPVSGKELITAVAVGCDVAVRMSLALEVSIAEFGWYPPPVLAAFGATAAAAKILHLNEQQVRDALSLTLCQSTCSNEIIHSPHSVIRAVRDAFAARAGVTSALLAQRGIRGFDEPLEGRAGFFAAFARGHYEADRLTRNLGHAFEIANISFKPWPSCRGTHAAIEAALKCREDVAAGDIDTVTIHGGPMLRMLAEPRASKIRPETAIDAKFSLPFTVATALTHGRVGLQSFQPEYLANEQVLKLAARVGVSADAAPGTAIGARLRIRARGGKECEMEVLTPLGSPTHPMSRHALIDKFIECAGLAMHPLRP